MACRRTLRMILIASLAGLLQACASLRSLEPVLSPPTQFQADRQVTVEFMPAARIGMRCAGRGVHFLGLPSLNSGACADQTLVSMPEPCEASASDAYAHALCAYLQTATARAPSAPHARMRLAPITADRPASMTLRFLHPARAAAQCGQTAGYAIICARGEAVTLANPCHLVQAGWYAKTFCHELGHANGWHGDHRGGSYLARPPLIKAGLTASDVLSAEAVAVALAAKRGRAPPMQAEPLSVATPERPTAHAHRRSGLPLFEVDGGDVSLIASVPVEQHVPAIAVEIDAPAGQALALFDVEGGLDWSTFVTPLAPSRLRFEAEDAARWLGS